MYLISLLHLSHKSPFFINHFRFLNLKIPKIFFHFNLLTILGVDLTLTKREREERRKFPKGFHGHLQLWSFSPYL